MKKRTAPGSGKKTAAPAAEVFPGSRPLACIVIVVAGLAVYANSFGCPFIFDDHASILDNPTIRQLWPIAPVLNPPGGGATVQGRPLVNLSLAVNWAIGQEKVFGYHVLNLAIHLAAALLLFGVIRRTLLQPRLAERFGRASTGIALASALLWTVHPLQTEAVTYIVQRAESMMALFYLLTLYAFIRGVDSHGHANGSETMPPMSSMFWYALSVFACLCGMASKEVMLSAPLVVLLYDRTFLAGSFKEAFRRRWALYAALACTWGLLGYLLTSSTDRGGTAGFGMHITPWQYALTELGVLLHYLRLVFWPTGLVLDYGWPLASSLHQILPGAIVILALLAATVWALVRRPAAGFLGACFFLILAPTSSFVPVADAAFEHRMYLPLAAVVALAATLLYMSWQRLRGQSHAGVAKALPLAAAMLAAAALGYATFQRNAAYRSELAIWQDTIAKRPENPRTWLGLGFVWVHAGQEDEAIRCFEEVLRLKSGYPEAENNMGAALFHLGRVPEAIEHYQRAIRLKSDYPEAENNLGGALARAGRLPEAVVHYEAALRLKADYADAEFGLANALVREGKLEESIPHYQRSLQLHPDHAEAENNLGGILAQTGRNAEAVLHYERALQLKPDYPQAEYNLGSALSSLGRTQDAITHFERALQLKPDFAEARAMLTKIRSPQQ